MACILKTTTARAAVKACMYRHDRNVNNEYEILWCFDYLYGQVGTDTVLSGYFGQGGGLTHLVVRKCLCL